MMENLATYSLKINPAIAVGAATACEGQARGAYKAPSPGTPGVLKTLQHPSEWRRRGYFGDTLKSPETKPVSQRGKIREQHFCRDRGVLLWLTRLLTIGNLRRSSDRPVTSSHKKMPRSVATVPEHKTASKSFESILMSSGRFVNVSLTVARSRTQNGRKNSSLCRPLTTRPLV